MVSRRFRKHSHRGHHPAESANNKDYESQICRHLDRVDKLQSFELATAIRRAGIKFGLPLAAQGRDDEDNEDELGIDTQVSETFLTSTTDLLSCITLSSYNSRSPRQTTDYFHHSKILSEGMLGVFHFIPARTQQSASNIVYHLSRDPSYSKLPIDEAAANFRIPDLQPAIADFVNKVCKGLSGTNGYVQDVGGRRFAGEDAHLHVTQLEVWKKVRLQTTAYHHPHDILPPTTINAAPPSPEFPHGHFDPVVINVNQNQKWPESG